MVLRGWAGVGTVPRGWARVDQAPTRHTSIGSVAFGALGAGVESPTVLGAARLRALGLSTPARPYGSLS
ncbi:hypothetical protein, partial [Streptomyces prunicolor]